MSAIDSSNRPSTNVLRTLAGLLMGLLVALLATSIVATSLPIIVHDLNGSQATFTWAVTSTLLAITVSTPLWGKLSDLVDRKALVQSALIIFIVGSIVAGCAQEQFTLIGGRLLQGVGAGGLMSLVQIVMADIISPRDRGKYMGLFGAVMVVGTAAGPLVGGIITDGFGWRWNFFIPVVVALLALVLIHFTLHLPRHQSKGTLDYLGAVLITSGVSLLLIWITLAGKDFAWVSAPSGYLAGGALVLLVVAAIVETKVKDPIIPPALFRNRTFNIAIVASLSVGVGVYGTSVFISQYLQLARGANATESGLLVLPQLIAVVLASTIAGAVISRTGKWKAWMVVGATLLAAGLAGLSTIDLYTPYYLIWIYLALVGTGIGTVMQNLILVAENTADIRHMGVTSASVAFFRTLGGTIGVTVLSAILAASASRSLDDAKPGLIGEGVPADEVDLTTLPDMTALSEPLRSAVAEAYAQGVSDVFLACVPLALVTILAIALLPNLPLNARNRSQRLADAETDTAVEIAGGHGVLGDGEEALNEEKSRRGL
ncbi:MDR family MFS transporter [Leifsonia sp. Root4]|uniref:MDR family MFS transporter n=1 Tax=Leifsonia sp. Root4 TaxID=1736525 RepID=UPI0009E754FF|nr:MDR family MFS transporter [Leifsonia sp. Root4]